MRARIAYADGLDLAAPQVTADRPRLRDLPPRPLPPARRRRPPGMTLTVNETRKTISPFPVPRGVGAHFRQSRVAKTIASIARHQSAIAPRTQGRRRCCQ